MTPIRSAGGNRAAYLLAGATLLFACPSSRGQQFVLFDATFTYTKEDADNSKPSKSHYYVRGEMLNADRPKDWTAPGDYRNGTVHLRLEVLEKPAGGDRRRAVAPAEGLHGPQQLRPLFRPLLQEPLLLRDGGAVLALPLRPVEGTWF